MLANRPAPIYVGKENVGANTTNSGMPIHPGEAISFPLDATALLFVVSEDADQVCWWIGG